MPYNYECTHFDEYCPDDKDAKECFWCFTRSVMGHVFDYISEREDILFDGNYHSTLDDFQFEDIKGEVRNNEITEAVASCPNGIVERMVFQYGYYDALRRYKEGTGYMTFDVRKLIDGVIDDEEEKYNFNRELLTASVSFEMNESLDDYYEYRMREGRFKPTEYERGTVSKRYCNKRNPKGTLLHTYLLKHDGFGGFYCEECESCCGCRPISHGKCVGCLTPTCMECECNK